MKPLFVILLSLFCAQILFNGILFTAAAHQAVRYGRERSFSAFHVLSVETATFFAGSTGCSDEQAANTKTDIAIRLRIVFLFIGISFMFKTPPCQAAESGFVLDGRCPFQTGTTF